MGYIDMLNTYAPTLTMGASFMMLIVTCIYVFFTAKQAVSSHKSLMESVKQFKEAKQPCLVPNVKEVTGCAFDTSEYLRIQFNFYYQLKNVGDSPALTVYTIATMHLKHSATDKFVIAHLMPNYSHSISINEIVDSNFHFETDALREILLDVEISRVKNLKRIETNPSQTPYKGPSLQLIILYQNLQEQWYKTTFEQELLNVEKEIESESKQTMEIGYKKYENVDNSKICDGDRFIGCMINPVYSTLHQSKISQEDVKKILKEYSNRD